MDASPIAAFWADVRAQAEARTCADARTQADARNRAAALPPDPPEAWAFGATPQQADELLALMLAGAKTGTASSLGDYSEGEPLPQVGDLSIVLDGAGAPRAVLEVTAVDVVHVTEVSADHAWAEGEGDRTLATWRALHEDFWRENSPGGFSPQMPVVCERFRVLHPGVDSRAATNRIVDLSHEIRSGTITYPGLPGPEVGDHLSFEESQSHYAAGTEFQIRRTTFVTSTGTYLDAPRHRYRDGSDIADLALESCVELPMVVVDAPGEGPIDPDLVPGDIAGAAVLFRTRWDRHFGTEQYGATEHPHLSSRTAELLVGAGVSIVGIDAVNVDATDGDERPIHSTLLAAGVLVVENLTGLAPLPERGGTFTAVPLRFADLPSFPVRAYARLP